MKIGVVALTYEPGTAGGIETYFLDLIRVLQDIDKSNQYIVFVKPSVAEKIKITNSLWDVVGIEKSFISKTLVRLRLGRLVKARSESDLINHYKCDVVHFPFQVIVPRNILAPKILSFMDMQQEFYPQFFSPQDLRARKLSYLSSCDEADHIIAISNHTRQTLIERYHQRPAKIQTIHLSYNQALFTGKKIKSAEKLPEKYFYYPAASWPHKNHKALIRAFSKFLLKHPDYYLLLSGISKHGGAEIDEAIESHNINERVIRLGYIDYSQLPALYQNATAMIFPSLFEGFGIPILEAMASSCPVAASNTTSIPEIAGDAALYFDPSDDDAIADKMLALAEDDGLRRSLVIKGLARKDKFSDIRMGTETLELYEKAYHRKSSS